MSRVKPRARDDDSLHYTSAGVGSAPFAAGLSRTHLTYIDEQSQGKGSDWP